MSRFDTNFAAAAVPGLFDVMGRSATYTTAAGAAVALTAIIGDEQQQEEDTDRGRRKRVSVQVTITTDAASDYGGVANPQLRDKMTIDGETFSLESVDQQGSGAAVITVVRYELMERGREHYRDR